MRRLIWIVVLAGCGRAAAPNAAPPLGATAAEPPAGDVTPTPPPAMPPPAMPPPPTLRLAGHFALLGVAGEHAIVIDQDAGAVQAVPLDGGAPITIALQPDPTMVLVSGRAAFVWQDVDASTWVGRLTGWSAEGGVRELAAASGWPLAAADDGAMLYTDHALADGSAADLERAPLDGAAATRLRAGMGLPNGGGCWPSFGFAGGRAVVGACAPGANVATVASFDAAGQETTLAAAAAPDWRADGAGGRVLVFGSDGSLALVPIDGGAATPIDGDVADASWAADGSAIYYVTNGGALRVSAAAPVAPRTLVAGGVLYLQAVAPDGGAAIFSATEDADTGYTDLQLVRAGGGAPTALAAGGGVLWGDPFTADGRRALFFSDVDPDLVVGELAAEAVGGGAAAVLGPRAWTVLAVDGERVVYNVNLTADSPSDHGRADLLVADLAAGGAPRAIAPGADADVFLTAAHDRVVYTYRAPDDRAGLWIAPLE